MTQRSNADLRIIDPVLDGETTAGDSLAAVNTRKLPDGSFCFVRTEVDGRLAGEWQLQLDATDAPNGTTIIQPLSGPGRWFWKLPLGVGGGGGGGISTITGSGGIAITNPAGPVTDVNGSALVPTPTIQNIAVAGPTAITDTMNTHARVDTATIAAASAVTLPVGAVGKLITVKDSGGSASTNTITVSPQAGGSIDGAPTSPITTDRGSKTYICVSTGPDVWDVQ